MNNYNLADFFPGNDEKIKPKNVFISYKSENIDFAFRLAQELNEHNITCWLDKIEMPKDPGAQIPEKIKEAIDSSTYFLLIYTNSIEKKATHIIQELKRAKKTKESKNIIVYPQDPIDLNNSKIKKYIKDIQWLTSPSNVSYQPFYQEAIDGEKKLVELSETIREKVGFSVYDDENIILIRIVFQRLLKKITIFGNYKELCKCGSDLLADYYTNNTFKLRVLNKSLFFKVPGKYKKKLKNKGFFNVLNDKDQQVKQHLDLIHPDEKELESKLTEFINSYYLNDKNLKKLYSLVQHVLLKKDEEGNLKYNSVPLPELSEFDYEHLRDTIRNIVAVNFIDELERGKNEFNGTELGVYKITDGRIKDSEYHTADIQLYYSDYYTFKCMTEMYHLLRSVDDTHFKDINAANVQNFAPFLCSLGLGGFLVMYTREGNFLMWAKRSKNISSGDVWHFSYDETVSLLKDSVKINDTIKIENDKVVNIDMDHLLRRAFEEEIGLTTNDINGEHYGIFQVGIIQSERLEIELISDVEYHISDEELKDKTIEEIIQDKYHLAKDGYLEISKIECIPLGNRDELIGKLLTPESFLTSNLMLDRHKVNVGKNVTIPSNTLIEDGCYIGDNAIIGQHCRIHRNVFIDKNVVIGNKVKIQNNNSIYEHVKLDEGVFVGTNVCFINDKYPRAILMNGKQVGVGDWNPVETHVCYGASIGAGAVILGGVTIGEWAMVGAGSVVVNDVPAKTIVAGNPAKIIRKIDDDELYMYTNS